MVNMETKFKKGEQTIMNHFKLRIELLPPVKKNEHGAFCNLNCLWCHNDYFGYDIDKNFVPDFDTQLQSILKISQSLKDYYSKNLPIQISAAGEPTLVGLENLEKLIYNLKLQGYQNIGLTTNGTVLNARKLAVLQQAGLTEINISLNSLDPKIYTQITGMNGRHLLPKVKENIRQALQLGLKTSINCIYSRFNQDEISGFINFVQTNPGLVLKFFDLLDDTDHYLPISHLIETMRKLNLNTPVKFHQEYNFLQYQVGKSFVKIKLSREENNCPNLDCPFRSDCNEGCRNSIRVSAFGIQPCGIRTDNLLPIEEIENFEKLHHTLASGGKRLEYFSQEVTYQLAK